MPWAAVLAALPMLIFAGCRDLSAQSYESVVGAWRLVAASATRADGSENLAPYGPDPTGLLIYTPDGRMSAILSHSGRQPLSAGDRISAPIEERAAAFATFFAYAGRYTIEPGRVIHHVEVSSVENWVNTDLVRILEANGDRITLRTPPTSVGGTIQTTELVWQRVVP